MLRRMWWLAVWLASLCPIPTWGGTDPLDLLRAELRRSGLSDTALVRINATLSEGEPSAAQGIRYAEAAVRAARRTRQPKLLLQSLSLLADQYARAVQPAAEQRTAQQILHLARRLGDVRAEALSFLRLAMISAGQDNQPLTEEYFRQALALAERPGQHPLIGAQIRCQWADVFVGDHRYHAAEPLLRAALAVATTHQVTDLQSYALDLLSRALLGQRRFAAAGQAARQGLALVEAHHAEMGTNGPLLRSALHGTLAATARATHDPATALRYGRLALADAQAGHLVSSELDVLAELAPMAAEQGRYAEAYAYQRRLKVLDDSLNSQRKTAEVAQLQARFQVREKQAAIHALTQQSRIQQLDADHRQAQLRVLAVGTGALLLLLFAVVALYWQMLRSRQRLATSETRLRLAIQAKDRLYALIAHDLRGPVTTFGGLARMIGFYRRRNDGAGLDELAEEVDQASHHLATLLDNLLDWARVQAGDVVNDSAALPAADAVADVLALYRPAAAAKHQLVHADCPPDLPPVWADRQLLAGVLRNLIGNAVKFTPEGGTITVQVSPVAAPSPALAFRIHNTGPGLPPARVAALLSSTGVPSTDGTAGERGTGLGLRVSQSFVAELGGVLQVGSTPGDGVWFAFTLPAAPATPHTVARHSARH